MQKPLGQGRHACRAGLTSDHSADGKVHGEADEGHEHPEGHQEVPVLAHTEQLLLQPLQATWQAIGGTARVGWMATGVWAGRLGGVVVERTGLESRVMRGLGCTLPLSEVSAFSVPCL
jgi:hypothetical protein